MGRTDETKGNEPDQHAAAALALAAASRDTAETFLEEQTRLTRLQVEREQREEGIRGWSQFVEYASAVMKLAFEFVVALIVLAIAVALIAAVWSASHDNGLVIEAFSVPPDLANRGLTGEVVAGKVLDRLIALQAETKSNRATSSYLNNWGDDIKVQIPETGVSIGQLYQYLVRWLGHETHISGEIYRDAKGLAVTARVGGDSSETLYGNDAALDDLVNRAAESVYRRTQPYRFAVYLDNHNRANEAQAIYRALIVGPSLEDRAWAYIGLSSERAAVGDFAGASWFSQRAIAIKPDVLLAYENLSQYAGSLQHDEEALFWLRRAMALQARGRDPSMNEDDFAMNVVLDKSSLAQSEGDFRAAMTFNRQAQAQQVRSGSGGNVENARENTIALCGALHDRACYDAANAALDESDQPLILLGRAANRQIAASSFGDWNGVLQPAPGVKATLAKLGPIGAFFMARGEAQIVAKADAHNGDIWTARALAEATPLDCVICLRTRGTVAALAGDARGADAWFTRAAKAAPSSPVVYADWGEVLLQRGDAGGAIMKLAIANRLGPRFADPLELWGEALIAQNRSDLALEKFAEAARDAPNWGRLHLKWGEALLYAGQPDAAQAQFAVAARLYLTSSDRATLALLAAKHG